MNKVYIKNMVCNRCIMAVKDIFTGEGVPPVSVTLGEVAFSGEINKSRMRAIEEKLLRVGFEVLENKKRRMIEKIKRLVIEEVHKGDTGNHYNFSSILSSELNMEYSSLSKLFSESENVTIEKYIIHQKIEKVKELLAYGELNLNEIAFRMRYSSAAHLSAQFRKITGFSPTQFRKLKDHRRKSLDSI